MIGARLGVIALSGGGVNPDFVSTWDTTQAGSASDTVILPLLSGGTYNGTIDWGDGNSDNLSYANRSHTYASGGIYVITISGTIGGFRFAFGGDKLKLLDISNWGNLDLTTDKCFQGCSNLDITATDAPIISTTTFQFQFANCVSLTTPDFSSFDTSTVIDFTSCFAGNLTSFNGSLANWIHSGVTAINGLLAGCTSWNQPVDSWDVSGISVFGTSFNSSIFFNCTSFNQTIEWSMDSATSLAGMLSFCSSFNSPVILTNTNNVTTTQHMFYNTAYNRDDAKNWYMPIWTNASFMFQNTPINADLSSMNTSTLLNMSYMFYNADGWDVDMSTWDINQVTNFTAFMQTATGLSTANYDALLIAWDAQGAMSYSGTVNFGGSKYTAGGAAEAARTSLINKWGGITDGGPA
jgi:hypothetical protein